MTPTICFFYGCHAEISIIAQFILDILQIQYWELLLACPGASDRSRMNGLNKINVLMYDWTHAKNQFDTSDIVSMHKNKNKNKFKIN